MKINTEDVSLILKAFNFAALKHRDQRRKDERASPYINHPITVAETLWKIGGIRKVTTLVAGILHDIIEDTDTAPEELERQFGPEICHIVKELTDDKRLPKLVRKRLQLANAARAFPCPPVTCELRTKSVTWMTLSIRPRHVGLWKDGRNT